MCFGSARIFHTTILEDLEERRLSIFTVEDAFKAKSARCLWNLIISSYMMLNKNSDEDRYVAM